MANRVEGSDEYDTSEAKFTQADLDKAVFEAVSKTLTAQAIASAASQVTADDRKVEKAMKSSRFKANDGSSRKKRRGNSQDIGTRPKQQQRRFSIFKVPLSIVMKKCIEQGLLTIQEPNPKVPVRGTKLGEECRFHQCKGHSTDNCLRLKHEIQNLIDDGKLADPEKKPHAYWAE